MPPCGRLRSPTRTCGASGCAARKPARTRPSVAMSFAVPQGASGRSGTTLSTGSHVTQSAEASGSWTPLTRRPCHGWPIARDGPAGALVCCGAVVAGGSGAVVAPGGTGAAVGGGGGGGGACARLPAPTTPSTPMPTTTMRTATIRIAAQCDASAGKTATPRSGAQRPARVLAEIRDELVRAVDDAAPAQEAVGHVFELTQR